MEEQKIKQDIRIGANIRRIRKNRGIKPMALVRLLQLEGVEITRESLVKIERGAQHIKASQLRGIRDALHTTYDELLAGGRETMSLLSALLDLIFPAKCPFCGRVLDRPGICGTCRGELPWTEGADALRRGPGGFLCAAPLWYQGLAREGLHRFKFRGMSSAAAPLGELIAGCAAEHFSRSVRHGDLGTCQPQAPASAGV